MDTKKLCCINCEAQIPDDVCPYPIVSQPIYTASSLLNLLPDIDKDKWVLLSYLMLVGSGGPIGWDARFDDVICPNCRDSVVGMAKGEMVVGEK